MGRTRFWWKVMLWPWPSRKWHNSCAWHVVLIWWSFLWNSFKMRLQILKLWAGHDFDARSCCDLDLQGSDPIWCERHVVSIRWSFLWNCFKIWLQIKKLWAGHDFAARSCCDLDLQGCDPNVARHTSSQYGDHFCEIVLNPTSNNKVMGRTWFCCKVMLWPWPSR